MDKDLDDRFAEVEIETSELNRKRDLFQNNETAIKGLEENQQIIQNEYDLLKAEENELNEKLQSQLKLIGKENYRNTIKIGLILSIWNSARKWYWEDGFIVKKADAQDEFKALQSTDDDLRAELDVSFFRYLRN